jgi:hypothetical protein
MSHLGRWRAPEEPRHRHKDCRHNTSPKPAATSAVHHSCFARYVCSTTRPVRSSLIQPRAQISQRRFHSPGSWAWERTCTTSCHLCSSGRKLKVGMPVRVFPLVIFQTARRRSGLAHPLSDSALGTCRVRRRHGRRRTAGETAFVHPPRCRDDSPADSPIHRRVRARPSLHPGRERCATGRSPPGWSRPARRRLSR